MSVHSSISLIKRSNGYYYILYYQGGKRRWKSTNERLKSLALKSLMHFGELSTSKPEPITLSRFLSDFLPFAERTYSKATVDIYKIALGHLHGMVGDCRLHALTMKHLDAYKVHRLDAMSVHARQKRISPVTVNRELQALRAAMNTAVRWKVLQTNPFSRMEQLTIPEALPSHLSKTDFQRLNSVIRDEWLKELVVFAVLTGLRRGEILNLRWQDIDLKRKLIFVQSHASFRTKNGKRRVVPMNEIVFTILETKNSTLSQYVFHHGGKKINDDYAGRRLKRYVRMLGFSENIHFHSLRHTFATWLVQDGVNIYEVQKLLGHSNVKVTEVYSHLAASELHGTVNRINLSLN